MAFSLHWYALLSFAFLAAALVASLATILAGEQSHKGRSGSVYRSLLTAAGGDGGGRSGEEEGADGVPGWSELWLSRWRAVHPAALLSVRLIAAAAMIGVLIWDLRTYDWSIMLYYTDSKGKELPVHEVSNSLLSQLPHELGNLEEAKHQKLLQEQ